MPVYFRSRTQLRIGECGGISALGDAVENRAQEHIVRIPAHRDLPQRMGGAAHEPRPALRGHRKAGGRMHASHPVFGRQGQMVLQGQLRAEFLGERFDKPPHLPLGASRLAEVHPAVQPSEKKRKHLRLPREKAGRSDYDYLKLLIHAGKVCRHKISQSFPFRKVRLLHNCYRMITITLKRRGHIVNTRDA